MMPSNLPQGGTKTTWSANQPFSEDFAAYYFAAQKLFLMCRKDKNLLVDLFDHVHEVYRMEMPYFDKGANKNNKTQQLEMAEKHDKIRKKIDVYISQPDGYKRNNFGRLYYEVDAFFSELTSIAVDKNFFPSRSQTRTVDQITDSLKLK